MKLRGVIEVSNRLLPTLNLTKSRSEYSYLSIGTLPGKKEIFILHQTMKNGAGNKYKVIDNIDKVFTRFVADGKATIRFKNPPNDLIIKCCPKDLKLFLQVLKACLESKNPEKCAHVSNLASASSKVVPKPKARLIISSKSQFPLIEGFPRSLEILQINHSGIKKLDPRILRLQHLKVLNLEDNNIKILPEQIDLLPSLRELYLAKNNLGAERTWPWIKSLNLSQNLTLLDLKSNQITLLPNHIVRLKALKSLYLDHNSIAKLPNGIGQLRKLEELHVSNNKLEYLPGSCRLLRLNSIDISGNPLLSDEEIKSRDLKASYSEVSCLLDISAQAVLTHRFEFTEMTLPRTLVDYLDDASYCECSSPSFPSVAQCYKPFRLNRISSAVSFNCGSIPHVAVRFCSLPCYKASLRFR